MKLFIHDLANCSENAGKQMMLQMETSSTSAEPTSPNIVLKIFVTDRSADFILESICPLMEYEPGKLSLEMPMDRE
jgi:hypothetical protein